MPKYTSEQKVVSKALSTLRAINPDRLKTEDQQRVAYAMGLLESILFVGDL